MHYLASEKTQMCTEKQKKYFEKKNLTQAKYYTSVIYGSIRMQQEVDAVLINSIVYIHTFIQIAFL